MRRSFPAKAQRKTRERKDLLALKQEKIILVSGEAASVRVDRFLAQELPWLSRHAVQDRIIRGAVLLNGAPVKPSRRVRAGDRITVTVPPPALSLADAEDLPIEVIHEDENILVVNKPPHVVVHPTGRRLRGTLIQAVHYRYRDAMRADPGLQPRLLHRLDRETSGVLMISKVPSAHGALALQFERHTVRKEYLAIVEGVIDEDRGEIRLPIGRSARSAVSVKMDVRLDAGRPALTEFEVRERFAAHTLVRLLPRTGRQHQLRVHLAAVGHPILADQLYKDEKHFLDYVRAGMVPRSLHPLLDRHALHAWRITLKYKGEERTFEAPLAGDLVALLEHLR
ncbi:MAG: RluA family pseudouridine synthase, partial [Planctomycetota bacterium]